MSYFAVIALLNADVFSRLMPTLETKFGSTKIPFDWDSGRCGLKSEVRWVTSIAQDPESLQTLAWRPGKRPLLEPGLTMPQFWKVSWNNTMELKPRVYGSIWEGFWKKTRKNWILLTLSGKLHVDIGQIHVTLYFKLTVTAFIMCQYLYRYMFSDLKSHGPRLQIEKPACQSFFWSLSSGSDLDFEGFPTIPTISSTSQILFYQTVGWTWSLWLFFQWTKQLKDKIKEWY